mgnify:CR=1 FL=1
MPGRLIYQFLAVLHHLDRSSGPTAILMDPDFREPIGIDLDEDGVAEVTRHELPAVRIPCQVEPQTFEQLRMLPSGRAPRTSLDLVMHFRDLSRLGLVDTDGRARIGPGDRLSGIYTLDGELVLPVQTPPGLFVTEARPTGFGLGLGRARRNLLLVTFADRAAGAS